VARRRPWRRTELGAALDRRFWAASASERLGVLPKHRCPFLAAPGAVPRQVRAAAGAQVQAQVLQRLQAFLRAVPAWLAAQHRPWWLRWRASAWPAPWLLPLRRVPWLLPLVLWPAAAPVHAS
jgi:hypothetical protein